MMMNSKQSLLRRLRSAVQRLRLLLSSTVLSRTWHIASAIRRTRHLSSNHSSSSSSPAGCLMICSESDQQVVNNNNKGFESTYYGDSSTSPSSSSSPGGLIRSTSCVSQEEDDIDKRAEAFITNFRRQLQIERQISLQLRYCNTDN